MILLALKLLLAPSLVALASLAARRWGLKVGGAIAGFPVVYGPIIFIIALEQGPDFAATAALRGLMAILPFALFAVSMSWACLRLPTWLAVLIGWAAYMLFSWASMSLEAGFVLALVFAVAGILGGRALLPHASEAKANAKPSMWDIPIRMASTLALLLSVTALAKPMGPAWSGAMASFPVASTVLGVFARLSGGERGPARLFKGTLMGSIAFGTFSAVLHFGLSAWGLGMGFLAAFLAAAAVQTGVLFFGSRTN